MPALSVCPIHLFGRVSKPSIELSSKHESAVVASKPYTRSVTKRKRDDEGLKESCNLASTQYSYKKPKLSISNPSRPITLTKVNSTVRSPQRPASIRGLDAHLHTPKLSPVLHKPSQPVRTLITLHKFFLKALSIHYAHNGPHAPAELTRLLETITRLWKERSVTKADVQKMLAVYELSLNTPRQLGKEIAQSSSPFTLSKAGSCISIEYVERRNDSEGSLCTPFEERAQQDSYTTHIYALDAGWTKDRLPHLSFFNDKTLDAFPELSCNIGTQTAARKAHVSQQRREILTLSNAAQLRNAEATTQTTDRSTEELSSVVAILQSRKQGLLDRIRAKQLVDKAESKPTPRQVLRRHALGRIAEVTEILRMMQQQHRAASKSELHSRTLSEPSSGNAAGRVSFSVAQIQSNSRSSVRIPISAEEVMTCLKVLSEELGVPWVKMIESKGISKATFVVLEGEGMSGQEVQRRLMAKEM